MSVKRSYTAYYPRRRVEPRSLRSSSRRSSWRPGIRCRSSWGADGRRRARLTDARRLSVSRPGVLARSPRPPRPPRQLAAVSSSPSCRSGTRGILALVLVAGARLLPPAAIPLRGRPRAMGIPALFIFFVVAVRTPSSPAAEPAVLRGCRDCMSSFHLPLFGTRYRRGVLSLMVSQFLRFGSMAAVGLPIAFAIAPGDIGLAFARLGLAIKFAVMIELTFRFIPSLGADLQTRSTRSAFAATSGRSARTGPIRTPHADRSAHHAGHHEFDRGSGGHDRRHGPARLRRPRRTWLASAPVPTPSTALVLGSIRRAAESSPR